MYKECVVSLESCSIEACHLLRPSILEEDMLIRLESAWGLRYGTLDSSSEANTIYLKPELRRMFESGLWGLLPLDVALLDSIINTDFTIEEPIETVYEDQHTFEYVFAPLPGMEGTITRLDKSDNLLHEHLFPYTTLPVLRLHVQPHYVIVDLYQKITKHENFIRNIRKDKGYGPYVLKYMGADLSCRCAYRMWKTWDVPPDFIPNPSSDYEGRMSSGGERLKLWPGAFAWDIDKVGLRPTDSVTYIPDREDGEESSDDEDEYVVEVNSVFQARMRRWVADIQPGLMSPNQAKAVDIEVDVSGATEDESIMDTGSPTMVGSVSLSVDKINCIGKNQVRDLDSSRTKSVMSLSSSAVATL